MRRIREAARQEAPRSTPALDRRRSGWRLALLAAGATVACPAAGAPRTPTAERATAAGPVAPAQDLSPAPGDAAVMFEDGAFLKEAPRWSADEVRALEERGETVVGSCVARRDAADACASLAAGCRPTPLPHAWEPCHGRGALCAPEYVEEATSRLLAHPPRCYCSCGPEHAAARARDRQLEREPPP